MSMNIRRRGTRRRAGTRRPEPRLRAAMARTAERHEQLNGICRDLTDAVNAVLKARGVHVRLHSIEFAPSRGPLVAAYQCCMIKGKLVCGPPCPRSAASRQREPRPTATLEA